MLSNIRVPDFEFFVPLNDGGAVSAPYPMRGCSGLARAELSPALCRMIGCNRFTEHLLEVIGGAFELIGPEADYMTIIREVTSHEHLVLAQNAKR